MEYFNLLNQYLPIIALILLLLLFIQTVRVAQFKHGWTLECDHHAAYLEKSVEAAEAKAEDAERQIAFWITQAEKVGSVWSIMANTLRSDYSKMLETQQDVLTSQSNLLELAIVPIEAEDPAYHTEEPTVEDS